MKKYKCVLLALQLEPKSDAQLIKKAKEVVDQFGSKLVLVHAIEHLSTYGAAYGISAGVDVEELLRKDAEKGLSAIAKKLGVDEKNKIIKIGSAKHIILEEAEVHKADLIIVGSHGRHGVRLLLGSTANAVLHSAKNDVLAVRVKE